LTPDDNKINHKHITIASSKQCVLLAARTFYTKRYKQTIVWLI